MSLRCFSITLVSEALTWRERGGREREREGEREREREGDSKRKNPKWREGRASGLGRWESHFHVGIWLGFWILSLIGATVDIWYNSDLYWLSICRHGSEIDNVEVRFSTVEAGGLLRFGFFLLFSLSLPLSSLSALGPLGTPACAFL